MKHFFVGLMFLAVLVATPAYATIDFDSNYESCTNVGTHGSDFPCQSWDDRIVNPPTTHNDEWEGDPNDNTLEMYNSGCYSGNRCVKETFRWQGPQNDLLVNKPSIYHTFPRRDRMFARAMVKRDTNLRTCPFNNSTKLFRFRGENQPGGYPVIMILMQSNEYKIMIEGGYSMGTIVPYPSGVFMSTTWQNLELEVLFNTPGQANGEIRFWVDGTLRVERLNLQLRGPTPTSVNGQGLLTPSDYQFNFAQIYAQCASGGASNQDITGTPGSIYWDNVAVGDQRIGPVSGTPPPPQDTVPPSIPTLFAVTGNVVSLTASVDGGVPTTGVRDYTLFRCGPAPCTPSQAIANFATSPYTDTTQLQGQSYVYRAWANDNANPSNHSDYTPAVTVGSVASTTRIILHSDNFNRADNTDLGTNYSTGYTNINKTNAAIVSQQVRGTATNISDPKSAETVNNVSLPNDQWCSFTLGNFTGSEDRETGCIIRAAAPPTINWYWCYARKTATSSPARNAAIVSHHTAGAGDTNLFSDFTTVWGPGDIGICEAEGTTLRLKRIAAGTTTEVTLGTATDSEWTAGRCGLLLWMSNTGGNLANASVSNFSCGSFGAAATGTVTLNNKTSSADTNTTASISWIHTVPATCPNSVLDVTPMARDDASAADVVTGSVTYGGAALTKVRHDRITDGVANISVEHWYLLNPSGTSGTIQINWNGAPSRFGVGSAVTLCGVDPTAPVDSQNGSTGTSGNISTSITTVNNHAAIVDAFYSRATTSVTVGAGQTEQVNRLLTGIGHTGMSTVLDKAVAGAETMDWTRAGGTSLAHSVVAWNPAVVLPAVAPKILSMIASSTGMTIVSSGDLAKVHVVRGTNSGTVFQNTYDVNLFPGGVFTKSGGWEAGLDYICAYAEDASGIRNIIDYGCGNNLPPNSSAGFSSTIRRTAPVLSDPQPSGILPFGTTERVASFATDVTCNARYHTSNVPFASMPDTNVMAVQSLRASINVTGLTDNSTTLRYGACRFINDLLEEYDSSTITMTLQVAAAPGDIVDPTEVLNPVCSPTGTCNWLPSTDNVLLSGYEVSLSTDACVSFGLVDFTATNTYTFPSLSNAVNYCVSIRAKDSSNRLGIAGQATFTTGPVIDITPPSDPANFRVFGVFATSVLLRFDHPTDDFGPITTTVQSCQDAGCENFENTSSVTFGDGIVSVNLVPGTLNRFRIYHSDTRNQSAYSEIKEVSTATTGTDSERPETPFGIDRATPSTERATPDTARPDRP